MHLSIDSKLLTYDIASVNTIPIEHFDFSQLKMNITAQAATPLSWTETQWLNLFKDSR